MCGNNMRQSACAAAGAQCHTEPARVFIINTPKTNELFAPKRTHGGTLSHKDSGWLGGWEVLESPHTVGGGGRPSPPERSDHRGKQCNAICCWESVVGPFLVHKLLGPRPPCPPPPPSNTSLLGDWNVRPHSRAHNHIVM